MNYKCIWEHQKQTRSELILIAFEETIFDAIWSNVEVKKKRFGAEKARTWSKSTKTARRSNQEEAWVFKKIQYCKVNDHIWKGCESFDYDRKQLSNWTRSFIFKLSWNLIFT